MFIKLFFALFLIYEAQCFKYYNTYNEHYDLENAEEMFKEFLEATEMNFDGDTYNDRLAIFTDNLKEINELNSRNGAAKFVISKWTHLTNKEFVEAIKCLTQTKVNPVQKRKTFIIDSSDDDDLPKSKDWRDKLPPVKNQKRCGTCWAFSGIGAMEGQYAIINNEVISLSEQQAQDCITGYCEEGGCPSEVFTYAKTFGGIMLNKDYPYIGADHNCTPDVKKVVAKVTSYTPVEVWTEEDMKKYVAKTGPLSIGLDASSLKYYGGGIMSPRDNECKEEINHAVLITGYSDDVAPHWVIRNSWGQNWGDQGYFKIVRDKRACFIGDYVTTVTVAKK